MRKYISHRTVLFQLQNTPTAKSKFTEARWEGGSGDVSAPPAKPPKGPYRILNTEYYRQWKENNSVKS